MIYVSLLAAWPLFSLTKQRVLGSLLDPECRHAEMAFSARESLGLS
jgi:hypothetical protein